MVGVILAGLMVSAVPDAKPDHTFVHAGAEYDVYVMRAGERFEVEVCARYPLTGTRIERNTCSGPSAQEPASLVRLKNDENSELNPSLLFKRRAAAAQKAGNALVNTGTSVEAFWKRVGSAIQKS